MRLARGIVSSDPNLRQIGTLSHLDSQLAASLSLKSSKEYKFWLLSLVRYLVQEGKINFSISHGIAIHNILIIFKFLIQRVTILKSLINLFIIGINVILCLFSLKLY